MDKWAYLAFTELLAVEAPPPDMRCSRCTHRSGLVEGLPIIFRCYECFCAPHLCSACMVTTHKSMPFHRIERWTEDRGFWEKTTLGHLGMRLLLGHGGLKCPIAITAPREMTIVHEHGIMSMELQFCECAGIDTRVCVPEALQLLRVGLFPGSWEKPRTAFTVQTLKSFHLLALQSQITANDFIRYLRRTTDNVCPESTVVSHSVRDKWAQID